MSHAIQGGQCGDSAITGTISKITAPYIELYAGSSNMGDVTIGAVASAIIGGTVSELTGGKFANGAITAAYAYIFNQVSARFIRSSGLLSVRDTETNQEASGQFFSGTGADDQIPAGRYAILQRGNKAGFRLEPYDSQFGDDIHNGTNQSLLRLHGPGRSIGCITACDASNWHPIKNLIRSTINTNITVNKYYSLEKSGLLFFRFKTGSETIKHYGDLEVK